MWRSLGRQFKDERLQQLFARYATYCGSSPWEAPATLMLIAQVELDGVWSVQGGIHTLAKNLETLARKRGVTFRYNTWCDKIHTQSNRVSGVTLRDGETLACQHIVFNGDASALRQGLLGEEATTSVPSKNNTRSLSAVTWSVHARTSGFALDRHNVFFQNDYAQEFKSIFGAAKLPDKPTVYVCAQDRGTQATITGKERLLCLINAPAVGDGRRLTQEMIQACQTQTFSLLQDFGLKVHAGPEDLICNTPMSFHQRFPGTGGALYGQATHGWMAAFARPNSRSQLPGLYLAGGSVHPGPGMPMAALSGRMAAEALMGDRNSTKKFHPAGTYGGTLTQ
jgi:1-hydroxycarotenoid 3,4-desaturase